MAYKSAQSKQNDNTNTNLAVISNDIGYIKDRVEKIDEKLEKDYVTHQEFGPIKSIVYGMVSLILTSVVIALIALVLRK